MTVLIVEDQEELLHNIARYLRAEAYTCDTAADFAGAREKIEAFDYDCILLDINLPGGSGLTLLRELKAGGNADGVIIISARDSIDDRIAGLNLGADDYLVKPFHLSELTARIAAVIRRRRFAGQRTLVLGDLAIDIAAKTVSANGKPVDLTRKEYDLLLFFASNRNRVVSKNAIAEHLSASGVDQLDNLDVVYTHIKNLKRKLAQAGTEDHIRSIYGMGYKFEIAT